MIRLSNKVCQLVMTGREPRVADVMHVYMKSDGTQQGKCDGMRVVLDKVAQVWRAAQIEIKFLAAFLLEIILEGMTMSNRYEDLLMAELSNPEKHQYQASIYYADDGTGHEAYVCETVVTVFSTPAAVAKMLTWRHPMATSIDVKEL